MACGAAASHHVTLRWPHIDIVEIKAAEQLPRTHPTRVSGIRSLSIELSKKQRTMTTACPHPEQGREYQENTRGLSLHFTFGATSATH